MNLMNRAASGFISLLLIFSFMLSAFSSPALASDLDADALLKEGWAYFHGDGVPQDIVKGISLIQQASDAGSFDARIQLAYMYLYGFGSLITPDYVEGTGDEHALALLSSIAEDGDPELAAEALLEVAYAYFLGTDELIKEDDAIALQFFQKASEYGSLSADITMGIFYTYGYGVEQDPDKALELFCHAYDSGLEQAIDSIEEYAYAYYSGGTKGIDVNFGTAFKYYEKLSQYGNSRGMYNLGLLYLYGLGVSPDREKGIEWIQKAADSGDEVAASFLASSSLQAP